MIENFTIAINIIPGSDAVIVLYLKVSRVTLDRGGGCQLKFPAKSRIWSEVKTDWTSLLGEETAAKRGQERCINYSEENTLDLAL